MSQIPDLADYGRLVRIPDAHDGPVRLLPDDLPGAPPRVQTRSLVLIGGDKSHSYSAGAGSYAADRIFFYGQPADYRALGLLTLACVLQQARTVIEFVDDGRAPWLDESGDQFIRIAKLIIDQLDLEQPDDGEGLIQHPVAYWYSPSPVTERYPLAAERHDQTGWDLPELLWDDGTTDDEFVPHAGRTVLHGFGTPKGTAAMADLLLDFALPGRYMKTAVTLEGIGGIQSVTPISTEAALHIDYHRY